MSLLRLTGYEIFFTPNERLPIGQLVIDHAKHECTYVHIYNTIQEKLTIRCQMELDNHYLNKTRLWDDNKDNNYPLYDFKACQPG